MIKILKDILIEADLIDVYYENSPCNLWRAKRKKETGSLFGLIEEDKILSNGKLRPADITIEVRNNEKWVLCRPSPRGISVFDKANIFRGSSWEYYKIPQGTKLPIGLAVVKDRFNSRMGATHYTIAPVSDMPLAQFKKLLDQLALEVRKEVA